MNTDINKRMAVGAGWMAGLRIFDRLIGLLSISALARLLLPADFGLVAYAMTFYGLLEALFQFSFEIVLIRDQERSRESYNTVWTLNIIKGVILTALLALGAKPIAVYFNEPRVETILYFIALVPILRGLENIGIVDFQKDLTFGKEFVFHFASRVSATIVTIIVAIVLRSHWALVCGMLVSAVLRVMFSYVMSAYRPALEISRLSRVFGFSKWLQIQNVLHGVNDGLPAMLIGRFSNAQALAFFNMGTDLVNFASIELSAPIRRVLFPGIAKIAHDRAQMVRIVKASIGVIAFAALPGTVGLGIVAPLVVPFFLGDGWIELVPVLQVLAANAIVYVILFSNSNVVYLAMNRPEITAYQSALRLVILLPLMFMLVPSKGAIGAAWALVAANFVIMIVDYTIVLRMVPLGLKNVLSVVWRSIVATSLMAVCVLWVQDALTAPGVELILPLRLATCIGVGIASYCAAVFFLWWLAGKPNDAEAYAITLLHQASHRLLPSPQTGF